LILQAVDLACLLDPCLEGILVLGEALAHFNARISFNLAQLGSRIAKDRHERFSLHLRCIFHHVLAIKAIIEHAVVQQ
jgi:hypothetical protein